MRRALSLLVALAVVLAGAASSAQLPSPDVTTLTGALSLRDVVVRSEEHSCSQSWAHSGDRAELALHIDAAGVAALTIERTERTVSGSWDDRGGASPEIITRSRHVLSGTASRTGATLVVRFTRSEQASIRFMGPGTLPLPPASSAPIALVMTCAVARTDVLPARPVAGERPTTRPLLSCTFDAATEPFTSLRATPLLFGVGRGVEQRYESLGFGGPESSVREAE